MGLVVYWFALTRIPKSILNSMRCCIYSFLWGSSDGRHRIHLVDWHSIVAPYEYGGWNIKHLEWFGIALRLKILWMVLNGKGIWSQIIAHKYLKDHTIDVWICSQHYPIIGTSYIWNGFIRTLSWITCQLGWRVGNGMRIRMGMDPIAGLNASYLLLDGLREYLHDFRITHLA